MIGAGVVAAEVAATSAGAAATTTFVVSEVKDEALSQATGGVGDVLDASKQIKKGITSLKDLVDGNIQKE